MTSIASKSDGKTLLLTGSRVSCPTQCAANPYSDCAGLLHNDLSCVYRRDIYVSEAHFIVRSRAGSGASMLSGLADTSVLQPLTSMSSSYDDTQAVNDYLTSRDVIERLIKEINLLELLSRPEADFIARFSRSIGRRSL